MAMSYVVADAFIIVPELDLFVFSSRYEVLTFFIDGECVDFS
jgi:hypothetical protein